MRWGKWWAIQQNGGISFGIHLEWKSRMTNGGVRFGPYMDLHFLCWVFSVGVNPIYAGELHLKASYSRGGLSADSN